MYTVDELLEMAKEANGRRRNRTIGEHEANEMLDQIANASDNAHTIRVYSFAGFVANSYKYRAPISYFEANKKDGEWIIAARETDAKRSHGHGSLVTINGRAAS